MMFDKELIESEKLTTVSWRVW